MHILNQERDVIIHAILKKNKTRLKIKYFFLFENFQCFWIFFKLKKKKKKNQKQKQNMSTNDWKIKSRTSNNTHLGESFLTHIARVFSFVGENPCEAECIWGTTPIFWERLKCCKFISQALKRTTKTIVSFLFKSSQ